MAEARAVGRVRHVRSRVALVGLEPGADVQVGERLDAAGRDAPLGVMSRLSDLEVLCVVLGAPVSVGETMASAGREWTAELDARAMVAVAEALRPEAGTEILETGIKAIDFLAPLTARGSLVLLGGQTSKSVLATELVQLLRAEGTQQIHVPQCKPLPKPLPELRKLMVAEGMPAHDRTGRIDVVWSRLAPAADPGFALDEAPKVFDATVYLSVGAAARGLYPPVDATRSSSRALRERRVDREHLDVHATYLREHERVTELTRHVGFWELLAQGARAAAARWQQEIDRTAIERASSEDARRIQRVRKVERFLTQPFACAAPFTGMPGVTVPRAETVRTVAAILRGELDGTDAGALTMKGRVI